MKQFIEIERFSNYCSYFKKIEDEVERETMFEFETLKHPGFFSSRT